MVLASMRSFWLAGCRVVAVVDRRDWTRRYARAAVDALFGMNVEHVHRREFRLILARMNAVNGTNVHARRVFCFNTRIRNHERHRLPPEYPPSDESVAMATDSTCEVRTQQSHRALRCRHQSVLPCAGIGQKTCSIVPLRYMKPVTTCVRSDYLKKFTHFRARSV